MKIIGKNFICLLLLLILNKGTAYAKSYADYVNEGNSHYQNGDYKKAAASYEEAAKVSGTNTNVFFNLGLAYQQIKDYPTALTHFEKFLKVATDKKMIESAKKITKELSDALSKPTTSGKLKNYEVWEGWVLINGDVVVPEDIVLTIKPGSLIMFAPLSSRYDEKLPYLKKEESDDFCSLIIRGTLIAEGEKDNEILFSNSYEDMATKKVGLWGGIVFEGGQNNILKYTKIERANNGIVFKSNSKVLLKNNVLLKNEVGIKLMDESSVTLDYNIFYRNEVGVECTDSSVAKITNSNFTKNNFAVKTKDSAKPEITGNTFDQNNVGISTFNKSFPKIFENTFKDGLFGISMTEESKALINNNKFYKNKIGLNAVSNSIPKVYQNVFSENLQTGITAKDNSAAEIDANTFIKNNIAILKTKTVKIITNEYQDNTEDIKELE